MQDEMLNFKQAGEYLGVGEHRVRKFIDRYNSEFPNDPVNYSRDPYYVNRYRVNRSDLDKIKRAYPR